MVIPSTGEIRFSQIQTEFGGANPVALSEYYKNATAGYASGVTGVPSVGSSYPVSVLRGKSLTVASATISTDTYAMSNPTKYAGLYHRFSSFVMPTVTGTTASLVMTANPTSTTFGYIEYGLYVGSTSTPIITYGYLKPAGTLSATYTYTVSNTLVAGATYTPYFALNPQSGVLPFTGTVGLVLNVS